jgi:hypothetical protein
MERSENVVPVRLSYTFAILVGVGVLFMFSFTSNVIADDQFVVFRGETLQISVRLLMNGTYGDPAPYQAVEFFDETNNRFLNSAFTDLNGYASIDWCLPLNYSLGYTILNATFRGNDTCALAPSYQQMSVIIQASTNLQIEINGTEFVPGDQMIFSILLTDDNANPLSNATVNVYRNFTFLISGKTNITGHADFDITCNQSWGDLGSNEITVSYGGNSGKFLASTEKSFLIDMDKIETTIETYSQIPTSFDLNDTFELDLGMHAADGPLSNAPIEVYSEDCKLTNLITNETGKTIFLFTANNTFNLGPNILRFKYEGTERYNSSQLLVEFSVVTPAIIKTELLTDCIIGEESILRVHLSDLLNRPIQNTSIKLTDSGTNHSFIQEMHPNMNFSDFRFQIEGHKGPRTYGIEIIGNEYVSNKTSNFTLLIWSRLSIILMNSSISNYASPTQIITLYIKLSDFTSNCSDRLILLLSKNGLINSSSRTDQFGIAIINISAPTQEGKCELSIIYGGNKSEYELSSYSTYTFFITRIMPVKVDLQQYVVIPSLQQLQLNLKVIAYNGSPLGGIVLYYDWLNITGHSSSIDGGAIGVSLSVPSKGGVYCFSYWTVSSSSVESCNGSVLLTINEQEAAASQGVGIFSISISIGLSLVIISIPRMIRKHMIGI